MKIPMQKTENIELRLVRIAKRPNYTIGRLYIGDEEKPFCETLEPTRRNLMVDGKFQQQLKVMGETAIPEGRYEMDYHYSEKFGDWMLYLKHVPLFQGILIHPGNTAKDTKGCILVGDNRAVGRLTNSRQTLYNLYGPLDLGPVHIARKAFITIE